jgi:CubicO group peptidase (beta-lactamase class C family)
MRKPFLHRRDALAMTAALAAGVALDPAAAAAGDDDLEAAAAVLAAAVAAGTVATGVIHVERGGVERGGRTFTRAFGRGPGGGPADADAMFLLGSVSKPIAVTALMTLFDRGAFALDDPARRFLPTFTGDGRERITIRQLLTHVSGLPDQLPENNRLRAAHAPLGAFVDAAIATPLLFAPGSRYGYSSMAILLAARIAEVISGTTIHDLVTRSVFQPLGMRRSAQGLGPFALEAVVPCQTDRAAPEAGGGDPRARDWDWNSHYWRSLGAAWGGTHASAPDVARFLGEFLAPQGAVLERETARLMIRNHLPAGFTARGLGFAVGPPLGGPGASPTTFGHTGSTGTIAWADPASGTRVVLLTSLPATAVVPHPRDTAAALVASHG